MRELLGAVAFDGVVETGTFRGVTTGWLRRLSRLPVWSVEAERRYYHYTRLRYALVPGIRLALGDSRAYLRRLAHDPRTRDRRLLFYLDAHGLDANDRAHVPLRDEVATVMGGWKEWVIVADDVEVPGDAGYAFARYPDLALTIEYLELPPTVQVYLPATPSESESGARRGCVVIAPEHLAPALATVARLRPA